MSKKLKRTDVGKRQQVVIDGYYESAVTAAVATELASVLRLRRWAWSKLGVACSLTRWYGGCFRGIRDYASVDVDARCAAAGGRK